MKGKSKYEIRLFSSHFLSVFLIVKKNNKMATTDESLCIEMHFLHWLKQTWTNMNASQLFLCVKFLYIECFCFLWRRNITVSRKCLITKNLGFPKCFSILDSFNTTMSDSKRGMFFVPSDKVEKLVPQIWEGLAAGYMECKVLEKCVGKQEHGYCCAVCHIVHKGSVRSPAFLFLWPYQRDTYSKTED